MIGAVASWLVVALSGSLKNIAIRLFGTNDKVALIVGIVIVAMVAGGLLGWLARRRTWAMVSGLMAFAGLGVAAAHRDPLASSVAATVASLLGVAVGLAGWALLLRSTATEAPVPEGRAAHIATSRRRFLLVGGALGAMALGATTLSRWWRAQLAAVPASLRGALPAAKHVTPISPGESFAVDGLTAYVTPSSTFYRIDTATSLPIIDVDVWRLRITGMVDRPASYSYAELAEVMLAQPDAGYLRYPCVTPMWDNSARRRQRGAAIFDGSTPELYARWLRDAIERFTLPSSDENLIFINAWNEWAEGNHLEPCQRWGSAYLEATRDVLAHAAVRA